MKKESRKVTGHPSTVAEVSEEFLLPKEDQKPKKYSKREKRLVMVAICSVTFLANSAYSSIAPFYPAEAEQKGVNPSLIGLIFSGYALAMCLLSPVSAILMNRYGRKRVLMLGCLFEVSFFFHFYRALPFSALV